jgi:hypothetical protein
MTSLQLLSTRLLGAAALPYTYAQPLSFKPDEVLLRLRSVTVSANLIAALLLSLSAGTAK